MGSYSRAGALAVVLVAFAATAHSAGAPPATDPRESAPAFLRNPPTTDPGRTTALLALTAAERRGRLDALLALHPDDQAARLMRIDAENELDDTEAALDDLAAVLPTQVPAQDALLSAFRAELLLRLGRDEEALRAAELAIAIDDRFSAAHIARGWALERSQAETDGALEELDVGLAKSPDDVAGLWRRAMVRESRGEYDDAVVDLKRAVQRAPDTVDFRAALAGALIAAGHLQEALAAQQTSVAMAPTSVTAWTLGADVKRLLKRYDDALADATHALELPGTRTDRAVAFLVRAQTHADRDLGFVDDEQVIRDATQGEALDSTRFEFALLRARAELTIEGPKVAKATLTRALQGWPDCARCLSQRAVVEARLGERDAALADIAQAARIDPAAAGARQVVILRELGDFRAAIALDDAALAKDPGDVDARVNRAMCRLSLGDNAAAIADYTYLVDHVRTSRRPWWQLSRGAAYLKAGDRVRAAADFRAGQRALPGVPNAFNEMAAAYEDLGDYSHAADAVARAVRLESDAHSNRALARLLMFSGRFAEAVTVSRTIMKAPTRQDAYMPIWLYQSRLRTDIASEPSARAELARLAPATAEPTWSDEIVAWLEGRIDEPELHRRADDAPPDERVGHHCEADYYVAENELAHGHRTHALALLAEADRICPKDFVEAMGAKAELTLQSRGAAKP